MTFRHTLMAFGVLAFSACSMAAPTIKPDYTIRVQKGEKGATALPPECVAWTAAMPDPFDNQPMPQFGCATARNIAMMSDEPGDLVEGRTLGAERASQSIGAIRRYDDDKTLGLVWPSADSNALAVAPKADLTGDPTAAAASAGGLTKAP